MSSDQVDQQRFVTSFHFYSHDELVTPSVCYDEENRKIELGFGALAIVIDDAQFETIKKFFKELPDSAG